ncbi:TonB-dependent receptor [Pedobacter sp. KBW06]|uniref:chondroitinase-B domain-containing protein n=1 Tax=Pedobacter sp. KBW06 TaxID=2153359 RepID=UPI000F58FA8D|nr:chondroitinase-B domain-containing protein [Pedobacter sp. KBW06]RQO70007.1 TonB-dependent receptor [Pedobacter sp. KBW06]
MKTISLSFLLLCSVGAFSGPEKAGAASLRGGTTLLQGQNPVLVESPEALNAAVAKANPGAVILLKNKEWHNAGLRLQGKGTATKPIVIMPETPGGVTFTGQSFVQLGGSYLVFKDFHFRNGFSPKREVISFRISNEILANNCRVTGIVIENYSQPERFKADSWLTLYGKHNRIDHSTFVNKLNSGPLIIAELDDERSQQNEHSIDSNYFKGRQRFGSNGGETIRIGVSRYSLTASRTNIVRNFFERCNGEVEIVSIKSGENNVSFNTFLECEGGLVLRHGSGNVVEGNFFIGNNKPYTGGVRVINPNQKVFNNVFSELQGTNFRAALAVLNGVPNSLINRYYQVKDALIERNTFIHSASILFGAGKDAERTLAPENVAFKNNLILSSGPEIYSNANTGKGIIFSENGLDDHFEGEVPPGFKKIKTNTIKINGFQLPYDKNYGADLKKLPLIKKENTGASWYRPEQEKTHRKPMSFPVKASESHTLAAILQQAIPGDTIVLNEPALYKMQKALLVTKPLVIMAAKGLKSRPVLVNASYKAMPALISIENGADLAVKGIAFKGTYESFSAADAGIRSTDLPMNRPYRLFIDDCEFYDYNESTNAGFKASKSTLADSLVVTNSIFHHMSGTGIDLASEKDDKGMYNAEYTLIKNCTFTNLLGAAINVYRGGNDESTLGPFVTIDHCTFNEVENREQGTVVRLIGAQQASLTNSNFSHSGQGGRAILFQEYRWDKILVDYCNFYESGKVESFYNKVSGPHIYQIKPSYKNPEKLNFEWSDGAPAANDQSLIGITNYEPE